MPLRILWLTTGILALGAGIRIWALGDLTPGVWYDEAVNAIDARLVVQDGFPVFFVGNNGREPLFIYSLAASFKLFGHNTLALRFVSMAAGLLTVAVTFALVRSFWGVRPALLTAGLVATSVWPLVLSRLGMRTSLMPLLLSAAIFWLWSGLRDGSVRRTALGGVFLGLAAYSYTAVRVAPAWILVFCLVWLGLWRLRQGLSLQKGLVLIGAFGFASTLVAAPLVAHFLTHPDQLTGRVAAESVLEGESDRLEVLAQNTVKTLGMLTFKGDVNSRHNFPGMPVLDPILSAFGLLGLGLAVARFRRPEATLSLLWLATMFLPDVLSRESPHQLRAAGVLPIVYAFPALGLITATDWFSRSTPWRRAYWTHGLMVLVVVWSAGNSLKTFFVDWAEAQETADAFQGAQRIAEQLVLSEGPIQSLVIATPIYRGAPASYLVFSQEIDRQGVRLFSGYDCFAIPGEGNVRYLVPRDTKGPWRSAQNALQPHKVSAVKDRNGEELVEVYELQADEFLDMQPLTQNPATMAEQFFIRGYDLPKYLPTGDSSVARIFLQVDRPQPKPGYYQFFAHFVNFSDGPTPVQSYVDSCIAGQHWKSGDHLLIDLPLRLGPEIDEGTYQIAFGMFDRSDLSRLPIRDNSGNAIGDAFYLGPLRVIGEAGPPPEPEQVLNFRLGEAIGLTGFDRRGSGFEPGGTLNLTLYWEVLGSMEDNYTVFVQVLDGDGQVVAQKDNYPQNGTYPTSIWTEQDPIVEDNYELVLPAVIGKPPHRVIVGMYRLEDGSRLPIHDSNGDLVGDYVELSP